LFCQANYRVIIIDKQPEALYKNRAVFLNRTSVKKVKMEVDKIMQDYGFSVSSSCSGFEWYKKTIKHKGEDAFITVTDKESSGLPGSMEDPVLVEVYDLDSGSELEKSKSFESLKSYLKTLDL
jgi:hypothetical protein